MMKPTDRPANQAPEAKAAIEAAIRRVEELDLDAAVREIANSGQVSLYVTGIPRGKERTIGEFLFSACVRDNRVTAHVTSGGKTLYYASARSVLDEFHDGPWAERVGVMLAGVRAEAQASADADVGLRVDEVVARFRPL